jgi:hypothetical protein
VACDKYVKKQAESTDLGNLFQGWANM